MDRDRNRGDEGRQQPDSAIISCSNQSMRGQIAASAGDQRHPQIGRARHLRDDPADADNDDQSEQVLNDRGATAVLPGSSGMNIRTIG